MAGFSESVAEEAILDWLRELGYLVVAGSELSQDESSWRRNPEDVVLPGVLRGAIRRLNPELPEEAVEEVFRKVTRPKGGTLEARNRAFHRLLVDGVAVECRRPDGSVATSMTRVLDADHPERNDWVAINQLAVSQNEKTRRLDLVLFLNGLPLVLIEIKSSTIDGIDSAFQQIQQYKAEIPALLELNELLVVSDGAAARIGTLTDRREGFRPWRTITGESPAPVFFPEIQVVIEGVFERRRFLDMIRYFVAFEDSSAGWLVKRMAAYYQFCAVNLAFAETLRASVGNRRVGVVHQAVGSGQSLTMVFYAGRLLQEPALAQPTLVVVTDVLILSYQLLEIFSRYRELLGAPPRRAESRSNLQSLLSAGAGGVIVTTIQKFPSELRDDPPVLSDRSNIVVLVVEAHRSQRGVFGRNLRKALPNAFFIGFTGAPIETANLALQEIFGDPISIYDLQRAAEDGVTVPVYRESRADLLADVAGEERLTLLAQDIVHHFERRLEALEGKALIVCRSRRACVDLYWKMVAFRPDWHHEDDGRGVIKVVMTSAVYDPPEWQPHVRNESQRSMLAYRFIDPENSLRIALVSRSWLAGLDVPSLHTIYLVKPMRGVELAQVIGLLSRPFRDKPGGLVVDYLGSSFEIPVFDQQDAVADLIKAYETCRTLFQGFDRSRWSTGAEDHRVLLLEALEHILAQEGGERRLELTVERLSRAFALAMPSEEALRIQDEVAFFQTVRAHLDQLSPDGEPESVSVVRPIVSRPFAPKERVDVFAVAGLPRPGSSILSEELLARALALPQHHLAVRLSSQWLWEEIRARGRKNRVEARTLSERLDAAVGASEPAQVIKELLDLARQLHESEARGESLGLREDELAFFDALDLDDSAVQALGMETLSRIARELAAAIRQNVTTDWPAREEARRQLRVLVKRILRRYGYPPDKQERATHAVLEQAEVLSCQ